MGKEIEKRLFQSTQLEALLLTGAANMRYVSGFTGEGYVYVSKESRMVVTDSRYTIAARAQCPDYEVVEWGKDGYYGELQKKLREEKVESLGFEDQVMTVAECEKLKQELLKQKLTEKRKHDLTNKPSEIELVPVMEKISVLRAVKTDEEQEKIRQAEAIGDRAFAKIIQKLQPGMTEKQVAAWLEFYMKEEGAEGVSFETIAASGIHSAMPHAVPTDKVLEEGDFLTMDFGCIYQGYCSDMTRTVVIGKADDRQREVYETVLQAQRTALSGIRPGMKGKEIDALARDVIEEAGYGEYFGHSLGHSVGLEIHESPCFSTKEERVIEPGMVITVEPGIYIEGFGGVRIEDVVIITENGCEDITHSPKKLIEIRKENDS